MRKVRIRNSSAQSVSRLALSGMLGSFFCFFLFCRMASTSSTSARPGRSSCWPPVSSWPSRIRRYVLMLRHTTAIPPHRGCGVEVFAHCRQRVGGRRRVLAGLALRSMCISRAQSYPGKRVHAHCCKKRGGGWGGGGRMLEHRVTHPLHRSYCTVPLLYNTSAVSRQSPAVLCLLPTAVQHTRTCDALVIPRAEPPPSSLDQPFPAPLVSVSRARFFSVVPPVP